jgi:hypothetical protein
MAIFSQVSVSLGKTKATPPDRAPVFPGEEDPPPVTIGMLLPLLWSGHATRCGGRPPPSPDTKRR